MVRAQVILRVVNARRRPFRRAPLARNVLDCEIGFVRLTQEHAQHGPVLDVVRLTFQPAVPPRGGKVAPLDIRTRLSIVRKGMRPWADDGSARRFQIGKHAGDAVAIAIEKAANEEDGNLDSAVIGGEGGAAPEVAVALVLQVEQKRSEEQTSEI